MASIIKVDTIQDQDGNNIISEAANTITIGASGDTITIPSGATFASVGIDDNATSTAITIDSSENIGIGTASPSTKLHVVGDYGNTLLIGTSPKITVQHSGGTNQFVEIQQSGGASFIGTQNGTNDGELYILGRHTGNNQAIFRPNSIELYTANTERMRITSSGFVGIGTSSPNNKLDVRIASDRGVFFSGGESEPIYLQSYQGDASNNLREVGLKGSNILFRTGATTGTSSSERMFMDSNGQMTLLGSTTSFDTTGSRNGLQTYYETDSGVATVGSYSSGGSTALTFHTNQAGAASTEKMRILNNGNVGIGTSSPATPLDIRSFNGTRTTGGVSYNLGARIRPNDEGGLDIGSTSTDILLASMIDNGDIVFGTRFTSQNLERVRIEAGGNLKFNSGFGSVGTAYGVRAWVVFDGNNGAIQADGNVSSVTRFGTGNYRVNFTNAMPDINYSATGSTIGNNYGTRETFVTGDSGLKNTGYVNVQVHDRGSSFVDNNRVNVNVVR